MRIEYLVPGRETTPEIVRAALALASVDADPEAVEAWTEPELVMAYDWAMREHLIASDNRQMKSRPKPSFVTAAEKRAVRAPEGARVHQAVRELIHHRGPAGVSFKLIMATLGSNGMYPDPDTVQRWLAADERDELIEEAGYRWRPTEKMDAMLYLSKRFPQDEQRDRPAPVIPDRTHDVVLSGAETGRLRAFLRDPNGSWSSGRLKVERMGGGGVVVRTLPYRVDEQLCRRVLEVLQPAGLIGMSPARLKGKLADVNGGEVMAALRGLMAAGEVENHGFGMWRVTGPKPPRTRAYEEGLDAG